MIPFYDSVLLLLLCFYRSPNFRRRTETHICEILPHDVTWAAKETNIYALIFHGRKIAEFWRFCDRTGRNGDLPQTMNYTIWSKLIMYNKDD